MSESAYSAALRGRLGKQRHGFALPFQDVANCSIDLVLFPQIPSAAVPGPAIAILFLWVRFVELSTDRRFEIIHHALDRSRCSHNDMDMVASNMSSPKVPTFPCCNIFDGIQGDSATFFI